MLDLVDHGVGLFEQPVEIPWRDVIACYADTEGDRPSVQLHRFEQATLQLLNIDLCRGGPHPRQEQGELVAAQAARYVADPDMVAHCGSDRLKELVAHLMTHGIVDFLEAVEIDEHRGEGAC